MQTRWKRLAGATALALALGLAAAGADAQPRRPSPAEHVARHAEQLGLDEPTKAALAAIVAESDARDRALRDEIRAGRERMRELLSAPELDRAALIAQADALDALQLRAQRNRLDTVLRIHELLTPEQRAALVKLREQEGPAWRRGGRRGPRGPLGACSRDLRAQCADAPEGAGALRCLADRWDALSDECRDAVARARADEPPPPPPD